MTDATFSSLESIQERDDELAGVEPELQDNSIVIDKPFDPDKIRVTTEKKNIDLLMRRIDHQEVDLAPEFQRRARVWHPWRKSQLIESLLLRIPLPVFYVAANQNDNWAVVDGLQRLTTIYDFVKDEFPLSGLEYLKALENKTFSDLDRSLTRRIEETELVINVIQPGTPDEVMINIFKRINTGGVPLTRQEIRNALNKGPVREFLRRLAASNAFNEATDHSVRDDRMDAQEMVLRFLAFHMKPWTDYKSNDLDAFLNQTMRQINDSSEDARKELESTFNKVNVAAMTLFGRFAFRKPKSDGEKRSPVSKPLFEAWTVNLALLNEKEITMLIAGRENVISAFRELIDSDPEFVLAISTSTGAPQRVQMRFNRIKELIGSVIS